MMTIQSTKEEILTLNGYQYQFSRSIFINIAKRKVFSEEIIEDNSEAWLIAKINEPNKMDLEFYGDIFLTDQEVIKKELGL